MATPKVCDEQHYLELSVHFVLSALYSPKMLKRKGDSESRLEGTASLQKLIDAGCDRELLLNCFSFARALPDIYPALTVKKLKSLASTLGKVERELNEIMPSVTIPFITTDYNGVAVDEVPVSGDFHVSLGFRQELKRKQEACIHIAKLCSQGKILYSDDIKQLAYVWPVLYVKHATGRPHYEQVAALLRVIGFGKKKNGAQLAKSTKNVKTKFADVIHWMLPALRYWTQAAGFLKADDANG